MGQLVDGEWQIKATKPARPASAKASKRRLIRSGLRLTAILPKRRPR